MNKTRVLHVRVVGFSAPERQMLNSIFLLSVAPARQIGYKLWNPEAGMAPDMYLLDGDSDSAVASWQATFASTSDRTLVVGAKNLDLGVASAARPLGLKVVGAMDRLAIALNNVARDPASPEASSPAAGSLPKAAESAAPAAPVARQEQTLARVTTGMTSQQPALSASMNAMAPMTAAASTLAGGAATLAAASTLSTAATPSAAASSLTSMTAAAPAATVLPSVTLQPNVSLQPGATLHPNAPLIDKALEKSLNEKPLTDKSVDRILSDKAADKSSPSALSAAVAPASRSNLRVVPNVSTPTSPMSASLPAAARIADAPMQVSTVTVPKIAEAPMQAAPTAPVAPPAQVAPPIAPVLPPDRPTARHEEHNFRVLAVDDSPLMRTFLQNKLQPYGINPEFAASGEEALFKISKQHYDMIFLDVMLPGMDGYDVCKMIKKNKDNNLMKVVMLTSKDKTFDKIRGTMAGCDGYLTKPVDEMKLRAIIERHSVSGK